MGKVAPRYGGKGAGQKAYGCQIRKLRPIHHVYLGNTSRKAGKDQILGSFIGAGFP
jgi:hypothetical protein